MHQLTSRSLQVPDVGQEFPTAQNIRSALQRGLTEFTPAALFNDGHFVVVGSGPSVTSFLDEIKEERRNGRPICAIKGAHDWLVENGLEPDAFVSLEPRDRPLKSTCERTVYMLASRCNPDLFDKIQGDKRQLILWHATASKPGHVLPKKDSLEWDDLGLTPECEEFRGKFAVGGGTTSGIRAIYLGFLLGFRKFILYGFDSCLAKDKFTKRFTGENIGTGKIVDIIVGGRRFFCNGAMAKQATDFQELYEIPNISIEAKGDGLIAAIIDARRKRGYRT